MRRMRSMLENLMHTLPEYRHPELRLQLDLLDRTIEARYTLPEDLAIARIPDPQGMGGRRACRRWASTFRRLTENYAGSAH